MLKDIISLSIVIGSRFLGLFIILPVLSAYAFSLDGANKFLVSVLMGVYALMQMALQIPFGAMSDKIGRKKTIAIGLLLFIVGSLICAMTNNIYVMIFGRFLQGSGAIGSVATAMIADFTTEANRSKSMAIIGMSIGLSFGISLVISPVISAKFGFNALFLVSGVVSLIGLFLLFFVVSPEPKIKTIDKKIPIRVIFKNKDILIITFANFFQKMLMNSIFLIIPYELMKKFAFPKDELYKIYILSVVFGIIAMGASGILSDKKKLAKEILLIGSTLLVVGFCFITISCDVDILSIFVIGVVLFFVGFNMLEPNLQSLISKFALSNQKGATIGAFNLFGYFGNFLGGFLPMFIYLNNGINYFFVVILIVGIFVVYLIKFKMNNPFIFKIIEFDKKIDIDKIEFINGISDVYELKDKLIIKYNSLLTDELSIKQYISKF